MRDGPSAFAQGPPEIVRVLGADPDLGRALQPDAWDEAARVPARVIAPARGVWRAPEPPDPAGALGLLVLDGLLVRWVSVGEVRCCEVLGRGDLLRPWTYQREHGMASIAAELEPAAGPAVPDLEDQRTLLRAVERDREDERSALEALAGHGAGVGRAGARGDVVLGGVAKRPGDVLGASLERLPERILDDDVAARPDGSVAVVARAQVEDVEAATLAGRSPREEGSTGLVARIELPEARDPVADAGHRDLGALLGLDRVVRRRLRAPAGREPEGGGGQQGGTRRMPASSSVGEARNRGP